MYCIYAAYNTLPLVVKVDPAVIHEEDYFQRLENLVEKTKEKRGYNELKVSVDLRYLISHILSFPGFVILRY